jgi:hypothetical protein
VVSTLRAGAIVDWAFGHYLRIAPPEFATASPPRGRRPAPAQLAA